MLNSGINISEFGTGSSDKPATALEPDSASHLPSADLEKSWETAGV